MPAFAHVQDGGGRTPTGERHIDESNTFMDEEISSSILQHSRNSSSVTTPSLFLSIFYKNFLNLVIMHIEYILLKSTDVRLNTLTMIIQVWSSKTASHYTNLERVHTIIQHEIGISQVNLSISMPYMMDDLLAKRFFLCNSMFARKKSRQNNKAFTMFTKKWVTSHFKRNRTGLISYYLISVVKVYLTVIHTRKLEVTYLKQSIYFFFNCVIIHAGLRNLPHQVVDCIDNVGHFIARYAAIAVDIVECESPA